MSIVFDGKSMAAEREAKLAERVAELKQQGQSLQIAAILYQEDAGSQLYTKLKQEAAERVGIAYTVDTFSMTEATDKVVDRIHHLNQDPAVTGIIIQKPWRQQWQQATLVDGQPKAVRKAFNAWWQYQTSQIEISKDVDGLHPDTLAAIEAGTWQEQGRVMPATAKAVLSILHAGPRDIFAKPEETRVAILGKSDILGRPLAFALQHSGFLVEMMGSRELADRVGAGSYLFDFDVIVSATGRKSLVHGEMVSDGVWVVDVGEPQPDVDFDSVAQKAEFITPVPGGVGPMTVVSLLENGVGLLSSRDL